MFTLKFPRIAAVAAAAALSCSFASADTLSMAVSANVVGTCKLVAVPALPFGTLDQVLAPNLDPAAVNVTYRCTKNTAPATFTVGGSATTPFTGSLANTTTPGDTIAYTITWTAPVTGGSGLGTGVTPVNVPLSGHMLGANYQNVTAGSYSQSVAVVITP
jgi:spore coat protein U-like protein